jgi:iron complex outermembrane receptor protein
LESDLVFDLTPLGTPLIVPIGQNVESEHVVAYQLGQRQLVSANVWYDVALFYNVYSDLLTSEEGGYLGNSMHGRTYGAELAARWEPSAGWRVDASYTYLKMKLDTDSTEDAGRPTFVEGLSPQHQAGLRLAVDLSDNVELDTTLRYVDELASAAIPAYTSLDAAISWHPNRDMELMLVGQNLLDPHHPEHIFTSASGMNTEVERGAYVKLVWKF